MKKIALSLLGLILIPTLVFAKNTGTIRNSEFVFNDVWNPSTNSISATVSGAMGPFTTVTMADAGWVGLGAAKGRMVFNDEATDDLTITDATLLVAPDTDIACELGRARIGNAGLSDYATFSHYDHTAVASYALMQDSAGNNYVNCVNGGNVFFRHNNANVFTLASTGLTGAAGKILNFDIIHGDTYSTAKQHAEIGDLLSDLTAPVAIVGFTGTGADTATESGYESGAGRTWTYSGGLTTDKIFQGSTYVYSFDGTDSYMSTPDTADMSFGDGSNDSVVSMGGWVEVVADANTKAWLTKWDETTGTELREWILDFSSAETVVFGAADESAGVVVTRTSDSGVSEGWHFVVATYDGTGGATAMNGVLIYVDGVAVASTAANNGSYVAMEDLATDPVLGAFTIAGGTLSNFYPGDMGRLFVTPEELSAATIWKMYEKTRGKYNK